MNTSLIVSTVAICGIPLVAVYVVLLLVMKEFKWWRGLCACLAGMISVALIFLLGSFIDFSKVFKANSVGMLLLQAIVVNGIIEETVKMISLVPFSGKKLGLKEFFCYGVLSGLTLACFETLLYFFIGGETVSVRFATAVIIHASCGGLGSLTLYSLKNKHFYFVPLIFAVLLHGVYDYFALFNNFLGWFKYAVVLVAVIECGVRYNKMKTQSYT